MNNLISYIRKLFFKMSSDEEYNIAARYRTVRKRLDSLGYQQALSLDALPLIERLLADLIQTTESLKHFKTVAQENIEVRKRMYNIYILIRFTWSFIKHFTFIKYVVI